MDVVALIHNNRSILQQMMVCTNDIARSHHIEFVAAKCNIIRIENGSKAEIGLNDEPLQETTK